MFFRKNIGDEAHALVARDGRAVCRCYAGTFLTAVLEREKAEKREARCIKTAPVNAKYTAFLRHF